MAFIAFVALIVCGVRRTSEGGEKGETSALIACSVRCVQRADRGSNEKIEVAEREGRLIIQ